MLSGAPNERGPQSGPLTDAIGISNQNWMREPIMTVVRSPRVDCKRNFARGNKGSVRIPEPCLRIEVHRGGVDMLHDADTPHLCVGIIDRGIVVIAVLAVDGRRAVRQPFALDTGLDEVEATVNTVIVFSLAG